MLEVVLSVRDDAGRLIDPAEVSVDELVSMIRERPGTPSAPLAPSPPEPGIVPSVSVLQSLAALSSQIAALHTAAVCAVADDVPSRPDLDPVADELAAVLVLSRRSASFQRDHAETVRAHPEVWSALAVGHLDPTRARILGRALLEIPRTDARGVSRDGYEADYRTIRDRGLAYARDHTSIQLDRYLRRLLAELGLDVTTRRRKQALAERGVWISHRGDGTADLAAVLASEDAERVYATVRAMAMADRGRATGSVGEQSQPLLVLMADALVDVILGTGGSCAGDADPSVGQDSAIPAAGSVRRATVTTQIHVTVPIDSLAGLTDEPGQINGFGAIPADVARKLAAGDARWRHVFVHRRSGAVLDVGTLSYRPPAALDRHVRLRDGNCRFPGCSVPAGECDLDHLVAFPDGPTSAANLHALCRHHHRLKHDGGWQVEAQPDHALRWTSPLGAVAVTHPEDRDQARWAA